MSNITTRAGKGSPLTNNELDANFTNLNSDKVEIGGDLSGTSSAPNVAKIQGRAVSTDAPAAGEKLVWNGTAWEPSTEPTGEPIGHADKTQSSISFDSGTRTFTIAPVATEFVVWCKGVKYTYTSAQTVVIPNTTGLHYIYFSSSGVLSTQMSFFSWEDHAPTAYVYWNATTSTAVYFGDERHGITLDWQTHEYLHRTRGAAIANGFGASNYTTTGTGATDADAQIDIAGGTFFDEDMQVDIVSTNSPVANTWQQDLSGPARIPVMYLSNGAWVIDAPTDFPFKSVAGVPQYNLYSGGVWSTANVANNEYHVSWILATNNLNYPVISIISQASTNQVSQAEAMTFEGLSLSGFPSVEFRPLYKVIYQHRTSFTNSVKVSTIAVYDLRALQSAGVAAALVQDHGNLSGLGDDDHAQYLHVSEVRSPSAAVKNSFLPSQTSNSGKYLSTDGTNPSWVAIPSGSLDFTGDVTGTGTTGSPVALTLANSGVTAGTYSKVTVDGKGRVTVGTNIASGDVTTALGFTPENAANKGVANGYAGLDSSGKIASSHLPSYVDDVLEYANLAAFPATGDSGKIYIAIDSAKVYRWSGSAYVEISASPGSTDAVPEGSTNLYHTTSRVRTSISASGSLSYNNTTGIFSYTTPNSDGITEGSTNLYFTNARARSAVSATGSLSYNSSTGVFSYTQPTNVSTFTNDSGYLTGITGAQVTTALGYTPPQPNGTGATGTWSISVSGNAATVTNGLYSSGTNSVSSAITLNTTSDNWMWLYRASSGNEWYSGPTTANFGVGANRYAISSSGTSSQSELILERGTTKLLEVLQANLQYKGNVVLHAGNYTSYSPSLTGSGASGTWGISISGASASTASIAIADTRSSVQGPQTGGSKVRFDFLANTTDGLADGGNYHGVMTFQQWADASGGGTRQLGFTDNDNLWIRGSGSGVSSYGSWKLLLNSSNYTSYSPSLTGSGASGTWGIRITGFANQGSPRLYSTDASYSYDAANPYYGYLTYNAPANRWRFKVSPATPDAVEVAYADAAGSASNASTVAGLAPAQFFNNMGNSHGTYTDFNNVPGFGAYFVQNNGNGPGVTNNQWYGFTLGLGNDYALSSYGTQFYWPRRAQNSDTYIYVRDREGGSWTSWTKIKSGYADNAGLLSGYGVSSDGGANAVLRTADNGYLYVNNWINTGSGGLFSSTNGAHWRPSTQSFGAWEMSGSKGGYSGIACNGTSHILNWMVGMDGNLQGFYNQSYGWQMYWSGGSLTVFKGAYGGGTGATVLDSSNYTSYALPISGGTLTNNLTISPTDSRSNRFVSVYRGSLGADSAGLIVGTGSTANWFIGHPYSGGGVFNALIISERELIVDGGGSLTKTPLMYFTPGSGTAAGNVGIGKTNPTEKLDVAGSISATDRVIVGSGQTSSWLEMRDTNEGTRYLHNNSGTIGFVANDQNWSFRVNDSGDAFFRNYGWLSSILPAKADSWYHSNRDFGSGTLIQTNINYAVTYGDPFILEIRGNSYGDGVPYDIQYQGYIYSDTIINHGGYSNGTYISGLVAINYNGNLCFWFPRQSYWNGFYVRVYIPYATYPNNRVTSITDSGKPTTAKEVNLSANLRQSLHSGNFNSYAPTLTGSGASGTWGINVTGSAASLSGYYRADDWLRTVSDAYQFKIYGNSRSVIFRTDGVSNPHGGGGYPYIWYYGSSGDSERRMILNTSGDLWTNTYGWLHDYFMPKSGGTFTGTITAPDIYTNSGWFRNHTNNNGIYWSQTGWHLYPSTANDFYIRSGSGESTLHFLTSGGSSLGYLHCASDAAMGFLTSGRNWRFRVDNSSNVRCYNNLYLDQNYGHGHVGLYDSYRYQGVFFMGDAYKMSADGTSLANMYGIGWSHPNAGGAAGNLTDHGMLIINNGSFRCAISNSIVASGNITAYSDERLKRNWRDMPENFVERLAQVRVGCYERIDDGTQQVGVSAQSLQPLLPEAIQIAKDEIGTLSVSYGNAAMASAVELAKELVMLKKELAEIKSRLH